MEEEYCCGLTLGGAKLMALDELVEKAVNYSKYV
jgi:hypothetical protein